MTTCNQDALLHPREAFERAVLVQRQQMLGVRNLQRMEAFLWDLELYSQLERRLGARVALKGGAAVQLLLPPMAQRTSVDIDIACSAPVDEVEDVLREIGQSLGGADGLFLFERHVPRKPKTSLRLATYHVEVPSVCTEGEVRTVTGRQRLKVELLFQDEPPPRHRVLHPEVFATAAPLDYVILEPLTLFADKLTTLGPMTVGIEAERSDEWPKQFYDLDGMLRHCKEILTAEFDLAAAYRARVEQELAARRLDVGIEVVCADATALATRLACIDLGSDKQLVKILHDFQSLYLAAGASWSGGRWGIVGDELRIVLSGLMDGTWRSSLATMLEAEARLDLPSLEGATRGRALSSLRIGFAEQFSSVHGFPAKVMKGKSPVRQLWSVGTTTNAVELNGWLAAALATMLPETQRDA